jgi:hypothetical protein
MRLVSLYSYKQWLSAQSREAHLIRPSPSVLRFLGALKTQSLLIYWLSELMAAAAAAGIYRLVVLQDRTTKPKGARESSGRSDLTNKFY